MNPNDGIPIHKLVLNTPADGEEAKLEVDYIRSAAVDFSKLKTGAQPEPGKPLPPAPDTGSAILTVSVIAVAAAGVVIGVKKRRNDYFLCS